jgi:hypothetical protein
MGTESEMERLRLRLTGYTKPGQDLYRNILFDQLFRSLPKEAILQQSLALARRFRGQTLHLGVHLAFSSGSREVPSSRVM